MTTATLDVEHQVKRQLDLGGYVSSFYYAFRDMIDIDLCQCTGLSGWGRRPQQDGQMKNCIFSIVRDDRNFLLDFIVHHASIGFDTIYIVDDGSSPPVADYLVAQRLKAPCTVIVMRIDAAFSQREAFAKSPFFDADLFESCRSSLQIYFYNYALRHVLSKDCWTAFIDVDEFIHVGSHGDIASLRTDIEQRGYAATVFDELLYGHGFHILPPVVNNLCSFIWCADSYYGHGKFFSNVGALSCIGTPHYPTMREGSSACDFAFQRRDTETYPSRPRTALNAGTPHLKHFIIQDVMTCFKRRLRPRIGSSEKVTYAHPSWADRVAMLSWTCFDSDLQLCASIIENRIRLGLSATDHVSALEQSLLRVDDLDGVSSCLDFAYLREALGSDETGNEALLFAYFLKPDRDPGHLRFRTLPSSFDPFEYQRLNADLRHLSRRQLVEHYTHHGCREGRRYR